MHAWRKKAAGPLVIIGLVLLAICSGVYVPEKPTPAWLWWTVGIYAALSLPVIFWPEGE